MNELKLGELVEGTKERDAIHIAVIPMKAAYLLVPGQRVGIVGEGLAGNSSEIVGIVDPFLRDVVPKGKQFWLLLLPGTITGMRHEWEHPSFIDPERRKAIAKAWLMDQCEILGCSFEFLIDDNTDLTKGRYVLTDENESARDHWYDIQDEFWKQREIYTGKSVPENRRGGFTCSC